MVLLQIRRPHARNRNMQGREQGQNSISTKGQDQGLDSINNMLLLEPSNQDSVNQIVITYVDTTNR